MGTSKLSQPDATDEKFEASTTLTRSSNQTSSASSPTFDTNESSSQHLLSGSSIYKSTTTRGNINALADSSSGPSKQAMADESGTGGVQVHLACTGISYDASQADQTASAPKKTATLKHILRCIEPHLLKSITTTYRIPSARRKAILFPKPFRHSWRLAKISGRLPSLQRATTPWNSSLSPSRLVTCLIPHLRPTMATPLDQTQDLSNIMEPFWGVLQIPLQSALVCLETPSD